MIKKAVPDISTLLYRGSKRLLKDEQFVIEDLEIVRFLERALGTFDIEQIALLSILLQTGLFLESQEYRLDFPNAQVSESFKKYILVAAVRTDISSIEKTTLL